MNCNLENIQGLFNKMEADDWKITESLNWGFFFFDKRKEKLEKLFDSLVEQGFKLNSLKKVDIHYWRLWISIREVLTPEELHQRNLYFNKLAEFSTIELYDGWDVEK